ncbi:hypothetical protein ACFLRY_00120 [Bacteroidota bacterium]
MLLNSLLVTLLAAIGIWKSVPLGFILEMPPVLVCLMTILGASTGVWIIYFFGTFIKKYFPKVLSGKNIRKKESRIRGLLNRYGIPGMGIIATLLVGPIITMSLGMALVRNTRKLIIWTNVGIIIWSVTLTFIGHIGLSLF